jgi:hypothetical protein
MHPFLTMADRGRRRLGAIVQTATGATLRGLHVGTRAGFSGAGVTIELSGRLRFNEVAPSVGARREELSPAMVESVASPREVEISQTIDGSPSGIRIPQRESGRSRKEDDEVRRQCLLSSIFGFVAPLVAAYLVHTVKS